MTKPRSCHSLVVLEDNRALSLSIIVTIMAESTIFDKLTQKRKIELNQASLITAILPPKQFLADSGVEVAWIEANEVEDKRSFGDG